jgi:hypothetical protein
MGQSPDNIANHNYHARYYAPSSSAGSPSLKNGAADAASIDGSFGSSGNKAGGKLEKTEDSGLSPERPNRTAATTTPLSATRSSSNRALFREVGDTGVASAVGGAAAAAETSRDRHYFVGQWVDVKDTVSQWLEATVMEVDEAERKIFVHYNGW